MNKWLKGLLSAIIGGAANSITAVIVDPKVFNLDEGLGKLASMAGGGALLAAAMYLKQSPLPVKDEPPSLLGNSGKTDISILIGLFASILLLAFILVGNYGCVQKNMQKPETFAIETTAMMIGYDARDQLKWTPEMEAYYQAIMGGKISLDGAKAAEAYLKTKTHPVIANRMIRLAEMMGFGLDQGVVVDVSEVDIPMLQAATRGFHDGLMLDSR